jgi:hypothetical protein
MHNHFRFGRFCLAGFDSSACGSAILPCRQGIPGFPESPLPPLQDVLPINAIFLQGFPQNSCGVIPGLHRLNAARDLGHSCTSNGSCAGFEAKKRSGVRTKF